MWHGHDFRGTNLFVVKIDNALEGIKNRLNYVIDIRSQVFRPKPDFNINPL